MDIQRIQSIQTQEALLPPREAALEQALPSESAPDSLFAAPRPRGSAGYLVIKRLLDIIGALLLLVLIFPLMLAVALLIKLTSPGPILFRQTRLGQDGRRFWLFKFRTMVVNAEQQLATRADLQQKFEDSFKIAHDPRVTPLGVFLRKTSLDELPQIINVLEGSMSVIGPRPIVPAELRKYGPWGEKLLTVKPGLGGMWQASGRSDTTYAARIVLDMHYIDHRSMWLDLSLLVKTAAAVLTCRGSA